MYGSLGPDDPPFREDTPYAPNSPYAASKAASDHLVRAYHHTYGLPVTTSNCSNNYGPYQFPEKLIPLMLVNALEGKPLPVYGDGVNVRDWLYVEDHCRALEQVLLRGRVGETYNIGGRNEWTNLEIVRLLCRLVDEAFAARSRACARGFPRCPAARGQDDRLAHHLREGSSRPRPALRHRRQQDRAGAGVLSRGELRDRDPEDRGLVSGATRRGGAAVMDGSYRAWMARQYGTEL